MKIFWDKTNNKLIGTGTDRCAMTGVETIHIKNKTTIRKINEGKDFNIKEGKVVFKKEVK